MYQSTTEEALSLEEHTENMDLKAWKILYKFHHLIGLLLVAFAAATIYLARGNYNWNTMSVMVGSNRIQTVAISPGCDYFSGNWVYDNISYPLYKESKCSFIENAFACERQGRKDLDYQKWRWQPHQCNLPRFDGKAFLEKLRGKKLVFVGDSVNRNQWESMLCLIESSLSPVESKSRALTGRVYSFNATEYNATLEFYWSPLLVESNCDEPLNHTGIKPAAVRLKVIETHAKYWADADILIFDSYAWWIGPEFTVVWGSLGSPKAIYKNVSLPLRLYEMSLKTWSDWLEININKKRTQLFFMGLSPMHSSAVHWGGRDGNCMGETKPIVHEKARWDILLNRRYMRIAESTIQELDKRGVRVNYINITKISAYRKEAHPSIYGKNPVKKGTKISKPKYSDCLHWCLPGLPDIWNQILYAYIMNIQ